MQNSSTQSRLITRKPGLPTRPHANPSIAVAQSHLRRAGASNLTILRLLLANHNLRCSYRRWLKEGQREQQHPPNAHGHMLVHHRRTQCWNAQRVCWVVAEKVNRSLLGSSVSSHQVGAVHGEATRSEKAEGRGELVTSFVMRRWQDSSHSASGFAAFTFVDDGRVRGR